MRARSRRSRARPVRYFHLANSLRTGVCVYRIPSANVRTCTATRAPQRAPWREHSALCAQRGVHCLAGWGRGYCNWTDPVELVLIVSRPRHGVSVSFPVCLSSEDDETKVWCGHRYGAAGRVRLEGTHDCLAVSPAAALASRPWAHAAPLGGPAAGSSGAGAVSGRHSPPGPARQSGEPGFPQAVAARSDRPAGRPAGPPAGHARRPVQPAPCWRRG